MKIFGVAVQRSGRFYQGNVCQVNMLNIKIIISIVILLLNLYPLWSMESRELQEIIESIVDPKASSGGKKINSSGVITPGNNVHKQESGKKPEERKNMSQSFPAADEALLKSGIQLFEASLYKNSQQKFEELKSKYPDSQYKDQSSIWLSKIFIELNNNDEAMKVLNSIGQESGEYPAALYNLAGIYLRKGDESGALEYYYRVTSLSADHELVDDALISISKLYLKNNKGNQALEAVIRVIKNYEKRETIDEAYFLLAQVFEKDSMLKDIGIARTIYKIFLKKADAEKAQFFYKSPLIEKVKNNLSNIENTYYSKAFIK